MTRPSDITPEIYEWAEIFCDENIHTDDRELVARAFMAGQAAALPAVAGLTAHQRDALEFIKGYIDENGISPSTDDIREHFGLASKSAAHRVVDELVLRGAVSKLRHKARSLSVVGRAA